MLDTNTIIVVGVFALLGFFVYGRYIKKDKLTEQMLLETQYDWGRKEVRKHTRKDLEKISKLYPKYKKKLFIGHYDKKGVAIRRQVLSVNKEDKDDKSRHYMIRFITPLLGMNIPFFNMLGKHEFIYVTDDDIDYENAKELHLKEKEMSQIFDVFLFVDSDLKLKKTKIEENVYKQGYEELTGRLNNEPAKVAQLDLKHTQQLAVEKERAESIAKMADRPLKTM